MKNLLSISTLFCLSLSLAACSSSEGSDENTSGETGSSNTGVEAGGQADENGQDGAQDGSTDGNDGQDDGSESGGNNDNSDDDGNQNGTGDDDENGVDDSEVDLIPIEGGGENGRTCMYGDEAIAPGTTVFSADGCTRCVCQDDNVECSENWECEPGSEAPKGCGELSHRESRIFEEGQCLVIELCVDGEVQSTESCGSANSEPGCYDGNYRFEEGERMTDNADGGACYCAGGKSTCLF